MNAHAHAIARDIAYLGAVFLWSILGFSLLVTGVSVTASLLVLVIGLPAWVAFAQLMRWTTRVDRRLAGWLRGTPVEATYASRREPGFLALVRTITRDPQTATRADCQPGHTVVRVSRRASWGNVMRAARSVP